MVLIPPMPDAAPSAAVPRPAIVGDRLYGIHLRPQELALHGERVEFELRYSPIFEDDAELAERHFKLLVLEIHVALSGEGQQRAQRLQLMKCGWELELSTPGPVRVGTLPELEEEVPLLLGRVADTVNDLARRAGLEAPLGPELVADLVGRYRAGPGHRAATG
jgi:hypothetical protein